MNVLTYEVLAVFALLATAKIATDIALSDPEKTGDAAAILSLGSVLAATLLLTPS